MWRSLKSWSVLIALLLVFGALAVGLVLLPFGSRVTPVNCERIKEGMTYGEVRAILGKPWDNSLFDPDEPSDAAWEVTRLLWIEKEHQGKAPVKGYLWAGRHEVLFVAFDLDGQVTFARLLSDPDRPRSWLRRVCWTSGSVVMFVIFDDSDRVIFPKMCSGPDAPRSWLAGRVWRRLRARYGW